MTKIKWTVKDKTVINSILPEEGSMFNMALSRDIRVKIQLTADEIKEAGFQTLENGNVVGKNPDVKISFTEDELTLLQNSAVNIKEKEKVTADNLELIEKLLE